MPDTILIVDDTPANLSVLLQCLSEAGHRVLVAEDGEEALALLAELTPDLILLDVMMPGIDGFETCRRLRSRKALQDVPVIFMTALSDTREKLSGFAVGAVDYITKPIQHEEALARIATHLKIRRLQRELADELALKNRFMRIAAHDLRNPLYLIMMAGAVASRAGADPAALRSAIQDIDAAARQMRSVIDTFLHLRAGDRSARLHLPTLVEAVVKQQGVAAEAKQQTVIVDLPEEFPWARGDATEVFQIVTNTLSNAVKFTPLGGQIRLGLKIVDAALRIEVADSGPGVPLAERSRLFTEYPGLSTRPTAGEESHGVGLVIVKQLTEANGGRVGAEFPVGGGSVFWCELPVAPT
jgi:two-component system, sensor histidine kinase and response regulator